MVLMWTVSTKNRDSIHFDTTQWSLVVAAGDKDRPGCQEALATLCELYWYPLYAYARRRSGDPHEAQDQTQAFFVRLLDKNLVESADRSRGRFRSFLLTSFKNFLTNEWQRAIALKRGGGQATLYIDFVDAGTRFNVGAADTKSPQQLYEQEWALSLLDQVLGRLREDYVSRGNSEQFDVLKDFICGLPPDSSYQRAAERLRISPGAAKVAASRLRSRYRELIQQEVSRTLAEPDEVEDEIRFLFEALA